MRRTIPAITLLQAFEACSRHLSVSRAAKELFLTQSAVSRQLGQLENYLGVKLFHRVNKRLEPTQAGEDYAREVRTGLALIETATLALMANRGAGGTLRLAVPPTLGTRWLVPRMNSFMSAAPKVMVNLINYSARPTPVDFSADHVDAAIVFVGDLPPGVVGHRLFPEERIPVCAPDLIESGMLRHPADLTRNTLLQHTTRPRAWQEWLDAHDIEGVDGLKGPAFQHMAMVAEAAATGLGVAIMPRLLIGDELASGRLVVPFDLSVVSQQAYYLTYPDVARNLPALQYFRKWLLEQDDVLAQHADALVAP